jgi:replicative DNA helicase
MNERDLTEITHTVEQSLLGALLADRDAIASVAGQLPAEAFRWESHRVLFRAMLALWDRRTPCDPTTAIAEVRAMGYGEDRFPADYILTLATAAPIAVHAPHYADQVRRFARRRALAEAGAEIVRLAYGDEDATETTEVVAGLREAVEPFEPNDEQATVTFAQFADERAFAALDHWDGRRVDPVIPTGLRSIDKLLAGGLRPGQLAIIGARPGMGKSALMLHLALHARAHLVSLEMSRDEIMNRVIALLAGVPYSVAHDTVGDVTKRQRWLDGATKAGQLPVTLSDKPGQTTLQIESEAQRRVAEDGCELVIIDHLDWLGDKIKTESPEVRTAALVHRCKAMARVCNVPVVVLAQLNRNVEHRPGFFPYLSDFRNSGAVEQDADVAMLLYRRAYYSDRGMLTAEPAEDYITGTDLHRTEVIVAKNRNGAIGTIELGWRPSTMSFHERSAA